MSAELTVDQFVRHLPQPLRIEVGPGKHDRDEDGWEHDAYRVRLSYAGRQMTLRYRKGVGWQGSPPTLEEVLGCIAMDSRCVEDEDGFEAWAQSLGFDPDSRKAEGIYLLAKKQRDDAERLLGPTPFALLLTTESL
jgi:hypothetical protein